ncbi:MAG: hypothetical protein KAI47_28195 [Deltaproteobacteria bacterium]|nr:hypothetical protein [Deltaproteobacteria bacterium]
MTSGSSDLRGRLSLYHQHTRHTFTAFLMGVPLTLAYALAVVSSSVSAEKRDFLIRIQIDLVGEDAYRWVQVGLAAAFIVLAAVLYRRGRFEPRYFGPLVVESMLYAAMASAIVWFALHGLHLRPPFEPPTPGLAPVVSALGEAVNEETLFRWVLLELLFAFASRVGKLPPWVARSLAVLFGAALFAVVGTFGAPLVTNDMVSVAARIFTLAVEGGFFGVLYFLRGYPACAYTHTFFATFWGGVVPYLGVRF